VITTGKKKRGPRHLLGREKAGVLKVKAEDPWGMAGRRRPAVSGKEAGVKYTRKGGKMTG